MNQDEFRAVPVTDDIRHARRGSWAVVDGRLQQVVRREFTEIKGGGCMYVLTFSTGLVLTVFNDRNSAIVVFETLDADSDDGGDE